MFSGKASEWINYLNFVWTVKERTQCEELGQPRGWRAQDMLREAWASSQAEHGSLPSHGSILPSQTDVLWNLTEQIFIWLNAGWLIFWSFGQGPQALSSLGKADPSKCLVDGRGSWVSPEFKAWTDLLRERSQRNNFSSGTGCSSHTTPPCLSAWRLN